MKYMKKTIAITSLFALTMAITQNSYAQFGNLLGDLKNAAEKLKQQTQQNTSTQNINTPAPAPAPTPTPAPAPANAPATVSSKPASSAIQSSPTLVDNRPPLAKSNGDVTNKNIKMTLEQFDKQFKNSYWRSEDTLDIEVTIAKGIPNTFRISGAQVPKGYSLIEIQCADSTSASIIKSLPKSNTKLALFTQEWAGMLDTETESGKPRFIITSKHCDLTAPGMQ